MKSNASKLLSASNVGERFAASTNESFLRTKRAKQIESRTQLSALLKAPLSPGRQNGFQSLPNKRY